MIPQIPSEKKRSFFTKTQSTAMSVTILLFIISCIGGIFGKINSTVPQSPLVKIGLSFLSQLTSLWFIGVAVGLVTFVGSFFDGLFKIREDKGQMLLGSIIMILIFFIVGYGTCAINIRTFSGF